MKTKKSAPQISNDFFTPRRFRSVDRMRKSVIKNMRSGLAINGEHIFAWLGKVPYAASYQHDSKGNLIATAGDAISISQA